MENVRLANSSLTECLDLLKELATRQGSVYMDEVPEPLKDDFFDFIKGHTLSDNGEGRAIIYDMSMYYDKVMSKGIDYPIKWEKGIS